MLEAGQTVDRYEVREFVGEGGMAMVYRARHRIPTPELNRYMAE